MTTASPYYNSPTGSITNAPIQGSYQRVLTRQNYRGIASIRHGSKQLVFRTNPNSIMWSYKLNTIVENTYGGRVVQVLSTSMQDLKVIIECGIGGWDYAMKVAEFMRNMLVDQRNGEPGIFEYTTRHWQLKVFAVSIPFQDRVTETTREIALTFKIQEDISGVVTKQTVSAELAKLKDGIGFSHNQFNTGSGALTDAADAPTILSRINQVETLTSAQIPAINQFPGSGAVNNLFSTNLSGLQNISGLGNILGI
jgi:hypothetical protein